LGHKVKNYASQLQIIFNHSLKWELPVTNGKFFGYSFMQTQKSEFYGKQNY